MESGLKFSSDAQATCLGPTATAGLPPQWKEVCQPVPLRPWTMAQWGDAYPLGTEPKAGEDGSPWATRFWGHSDSQEYTPIVRGHGGEVVVGHPQQEKGVPAAGHASRAPDSLSFLQGRGLLGPSLRALPHLVL